MERTTSHNKFLRIITIPIRALGKARDLYVKSMNGYAAKGCYGGGASFGFTVAEPLPRSFSTNSVRSYSSESDDLRELIRAASSRVYADKLDLAALDHQPIIPRSHQRPPLPPRHRNAANETAGRYAKGVPRSASVGMAKIEEDKPCDFEGDERIRNGKANGHSAKDKKKGSDLFARSRSYAVSSPTTTRSESKFGGGKETIFFVTS